MFLTQGLTSSEVISVVVMENVLNTKMEIHERYDLKGSWVRRKVGAAFEANRSKVLGMDLDLHHKLMLQSDQVTQLRRLISYDATFLRECGIMDYSLLLGFHFLDKGSSNLDPEAAAGEAEQVPQPDLKRPFWQQYDGGLLSATGDGIYFMGIIDILQAYNGSKKRERCCKVYFLRKDPRGVSVQPVDVYCTRYLRAMANLMVSVNDGDE
jgi:1-phosphatidylinositol-4-phosphate 5-kinase